MQYWKLLFTCKFKVVMQIEYANVWVRTMNQIESTCKNEHLSQKLMTIIKGFISI